MGSTSFGSWGYYLHISTLRWLLIVANCATHLINSVGQSAATWNWVDCLLVLWTTHYRHLATHSHPLDIMNRALYVFEFAAAVEVLATVDGIIGTHPLNDKAILNDLIHIRFLAVQTLLYLVVRLLNKP